MTTITIDQSQFLAGHRAFLRYMLDQSGGERFEDFDHSFFYADEINYKSEVIVDGRRSLSLDEWKHWLQRSPERIIEATKKACSPSVSANLMINRSGMLDSYQAPLYRVTTIVEVSGLAEQLYQFLCGGPDDPSSFGPRFDALANYLREHSLSCKWRFPAYLAFLLNHKRYILIAPRQVDRLLDFYGINERISGTITWSSYSLVLDAARELQGLLGDRYRRQPDMLEVQSYMWVVSRLNEKGLIGEQPATITPTSDDELAKRQRRARDRERRGLLGEKHVLDHEKARLRGAGRPDLADQVQWVAVDEESAGYDILSFEPDGTPLHMEVKTTSRSAVTDQGFWLSGNERVQGSQDPYWCVVRVWDIDSAPNHQSLGNIVTGDGRGWALSPASWQVERSKDWGLVFTEPGGEETRRELAKYPLVDRFFGDCIIQLQSDPPEDGRFAHLLPRGNLKKLEERLARVQNTEAFRAIFSEVGRIRDNPVELDRRLMDAWAEIRVLDQLLRERFLDAKKAKRPGVDFEARRMSQHYAIQVTRISKKPKFSYPPTGKGVDDIYEEVEGPIGGHFWATIETKNAKFKKVDPSKYVRRISVVTSTDRLQIRLSRHIACRQIKDSILALTSRYFEEIQWLPDEGNGAIFWVEIVEGEERVRCVTDWRDDPAHPHHGDLENCYWQEIDLDSEVPLNRR